VNRGQRKMTQPTCILTPKAACLLALLTGPAAAEGVTVLDQRILGETTMAGEKVGEFSAVVRNTSGEGILAISDRGYIADFAVDVTGGKFVRLDLRAVHVLTGPDGVPIRDAGFNSEAAALMPDGRIAIVDESGPRLAMFDSTGKWIADGLLPEQVRDASRQASGKDGIEALAWTEETGFIAMTEEPQLGQPRNLHTIHTERAGSAQIGTSAEESLSIKGMDTFGSTLYVLERTRDNAADTLHPFLRVIDLPACLAGGDCLGQQLPIQLDGINDADFEGLVALGDGLFLKVSDDKIDGDLRSVFVLFRLE
jgi:hypothetical protein